MCDFDIDCSTNFSNQKSLFVSMYSNQASQELEAMCRTHLKNDNFCAKNITFLNIQIYTLMLCFYMWIIHS